MELTPSILPLCSYNKFPILHMYPRTESNTPIHTGGDLIKSHFWLEIPLKIGPPDNSDKSISV